MQSLPSPKRGQRFVLSQDLHKKSIQAVSMETLPVNRLRMYRKYSERRLIRDWVYFSLRAIAFSAATTMSAASR